MLFYDRRLALSPESRTRKLSLQQAINRLLECFKRLGANDSFPIDDETGGALYANLASDIGLRLNQLGVLAAVQALIEGFGIQA